MTAPATEAAFAIPGDLTTETGGYAYARAVLTRLPEFGVAPDHVVLPGGYPFPTANDIAETERVLAGITPAVPIMIDGLAFGAFPGELAAAIPNPLIALVHHPLGYESGLDPETADTLIASERRALAAADCVIAASPTTKRALIEAFGVPADRITVALPGTEPRKRSTGSQKPDGPIELLAVGAISPRKGFDVLVDALAGLTDQDWRLTILGDTERQSDVTQALHEGIARHGLGERVRLAGRVSDAAKDRSFAAADVFVLSSHYEGYGMVLAEALASGLPIVATTGGAAAETVPDAAALKVGPGDPVALRSALARMIGDTTLRTRCADAAWQAGQALPTWQDTTRTIAGVLRSFAA
ncbi:MAG: glycosyltransferase family 4 protein [Pseudomonadota bacterium]